MAKNTYTPVSYWEELTLRRFRQWIAANNRVCEDERAEWEKLRKRG